jgi:hypothetical protein
MNISMSAILALRARIAAQVDTLGAEGWMDMPVPTTVRPDGVLRVPRGAFEMWAVWRSGGAHLAVPWTPVSPRGLKQGADDPYHTDWMLGAGLGPQDMREGGGNPHWWALSDAAYAARQEIERRLLGFSCSVLLPGPTVVGRVHVPKSTGSNATGRLDLPEPDEDGQPPVLVVRDASSAWLDHAIAALNAGGAVIVENGGEMSHLITVARGMSKGPFVRMPNARRLYPDGSVVCVSPGEGTIELREDERRIATFMMGLLSPTVMPPPMPAAEPIVPRATAQDIPNHEEAATGARTMPFVLTERKRGEPASQTEGKHYELVQSRIQGPNHVVYCVAFTNEVLSPTLARGHRSMMPGSMGFRARAVSS